MNGQTTYHVTGTCKMGQDSLAVVDDELRVHGVAGMRPLGATSSGRSIIRQFGGAPMRIAGDSGARLSKPAKSYHQSKIESRLSTRSCPISLGG
jgi:choline dehydrogenase